MDRIFVVCQGVSGAPRFDGERRATPLSGECAVPQVRESAGRLLAMALEAELLHFLDSIAREAGPCPCAVVRNGYQPERAVRTAIGPIPVRLPKVRRRGGVAPRFRSVLLPRYARRVTGVPARRTCAAYVRAMLAGDAAGALGALLGPRIVPGSVVNRLEDWRRSWRPSAGAYTRFDAKCARAECQCNRAEGGY